MKKNEAMDFDVSDTPREPTPASRKAPPPGPHLSQSPKKKGAYSAYNPGMPPQRQQEATPFDPGGRRRANTPTQQLSPMGPEQQSSPTGKWDVDLPNGMRIRIPATSPEVAKKTAGEWMRRQPDAGGGRQQDVDFTRFKVTPVMSDTEQEGATAGGSLAGMQAPIGDRVREAIRARIRERVRQRLAEIVRKKGGGGGYNLYSPNQGKKKDPKPVGEFPTRLQAKEAELQRFPPKDPEQLKRARKRLDKLRKDPKKRIEKEKGELGGGRKGPKSKKRKSSKKEALMRAMTAELRERLFREDEIPGSPWDERIGSLHPDAISSDKKLHALHRGLEGASVGALGDGHKAMARALRGIAKVHPGEHAFDNERKKMYLPVHMEVGGEPIGPVHLYVDGGHVKIEISQDAREQIAALEPKAARDLRGGLMDLEEDHLPKIDRAKKAWDERDAYLDKVHGKLEKHIGGMSGVEAHLAKALLQKHGKGKK